MSTVSPEDAAVTAAVERFYAAIEALVTGRGTQLMKEAWHHTEPGHRGAPARRVVGYGWEEILATWEVVAGLGVADNFGSHIRGLQVRVYGDCAYSTCVFVAGPRFGRATVNCTNVLVRADGEWKIVHHHADKSQAIERGLEEIAGTDSAPPVAS